MRTLVPHLGPRGQGRKCHATSGLTTQPSAVQGSAVPPRRPAHPCALPRPAYPGLRAHPPRQAGGFFDPGRPRLRSRVRVPTARRCWPQGGASVPELAQVPLQPPHQLPEFSHCYVMPASILAP